MWAEWPMPFEMKAAVAALAAPPHNLPVGTTSFVGRRLEVAEVVRLLTRGLGRAAPAGAPASRWRP